MLDGVIYLILFVAVVPTQSTSAGTKQDDNSVRIKERRSVIIGRSPTTTLKMIKYCSYSNQHNQHHHGDDETRYRANHVAPQIPN